MPADLSPPGTRHATGSASRKCHLRADYEDTSHPQENASFGAGEIFVSVSGSQDDDGTSNRGWTAGGLESSGDQSGRPRNRAHSGFGVSTTGAHGDFVDRVRA